MNSSIIPRFLCFLFGFSIVMTLFITTSSESGGVNSKDNVVEGVIDCYTVTTSRDSNVSIFNKKVSHTGYLDRAPKESLNFNISVRDMEGKSYYYSSNDESVYLKAKAIGTGMKANLIIRDEHLVDITLPTDEVGYVYIDSFPNIEGDGSILNINGIKYVKKVEE